MNGWVIFGILFFISVVAIISAIVSKLLIGTKEKIQNFQEEQERQRLEQERLTREHIAAQKRERQEIEAALKHKEALRKKKEGFAKEVEKKCDDEIKILIGGLLTRASKNDIDKDDKMRIDVYQDVLDTREKERVRRGQQKKVEEERKRRHEEKIRLQDQRKKELEEQVRKRKEVREETLRMRQGARQAQINAQKTRQEIIRQANAAKKQAFSAAEKIKKEALRSLTMKGLTLPTDYSKSLFQDKFKDKLNNIEIELDKRH